MLKDRFVEELIDKVSGYFEEDFKYIFSITGDPVTQPGDITFHTKVLVFSKRRYFKGYSKTRDYSLSSLEYDNIKLH